MAPVNGGYEEGTSLPGVGKRMQLPCAIAAALGLVAGP